MSDLEQLIDVMRHIDFLKAEAQRMLEVPVDDRDDKFYSRIMWMSQEFEELQHTKAILIERCQNPSAEFLAWIAEKFGIDKPPYTSEI